MKHSEKKTLWIYVELINPRIEYTFALLFEWVFPLPYRITTDWKEWENYDGPCLNYSRKPSAKKAFWIPAGVLLYEKEIRPQNVELKVRDGLPCFFFEWLSGTDLPFDLPAMAFYLASRYEEYLPFEPDVHGRFPATQSLAGQGGFLRLPLINLWVGRVVNALKARYSVWEISAPVFRFMPSFDIDMAWAFLHRRWWVQMGGIGKALIQGRWADLKRRRQAMSGDRPDPFFSFPLIRELHPPDEKNTPRFFFLLGDYGPYDKNIRHDHPALRTLIQSLANDYETGIHLSYRSNQQHTQIPKEIDRLSGIIGQPVLRNRQHFLKLHFPDTYRQLLDNHIREDYSMGYADDIGFRASLANAFPWYDLEKGKTTDLVIYPFQVMDVSLKNYLQLTSEEAWLPVWEMVEKTQKIGGQFCTLWHNSSFSDLEGWERWAAFYKRLIGEIKRLN